MAETLYLRLGTERLQWLVADDRDHLQLKGEGDDSALTEAIDIENFTGAVVVVVPGEDVLLTQASVPSKQYRQIVQAVPYVVEEQLAVDVETCFFALGGRDSTGDIRVSVVSRDLMVAWVEQLARLGIVARVMISENQLVVAEDQIKVVIDEGRAHIRWPGGAATVDRADLPLTVSLVDNTLPIEIFIDAERTADIDLQINELRASEREVNVTPLDVSVFQYLCSQIQPDQINLLQGEFKVEEKRTGQQIVWRSVAVLVVCAVLLHMATLIGQGWYLASKAQAFESRTMALYKEVFPADRNVRDVRRRWNSHLGKSGADDSQFLSLFAQSSRGLPAAGLTLNNVNFNESRGDLILQVSGKRSEELVQYAQRLSSQGIDAEIGTISQEEDTVRGSIKVRAGGGAS